VIDPDLGQQLDAFIEQIRVDPSKRAVIDTWDQAQLRLFCELL
jgi:hypothetical protein